MQMITARAVANYFIKRGIEDNMPVDQLKIQKLVYYAYAWYMANNNKKQLFSEDICAWPHGPVIAELWREFRESGRAPITKFATELEFELDGKGEIQVDVVTPKVEDQEVAKFLEAVWGTYKPYSGTVLSNMTHAPDEPWAIVRKKINVSDRPRIPDEIIYEAFKSKINKSKMDKVRQAGDHE